MNNKAFTLIELLVVISIIGVLSSIVLVSFSGSRDKARLAKAQNFDAQISHALGAYAVGIWRFEESSGITLHDESGYGNDGTFVGNPTPVFPVGVYSGTTALQFDGSNDYINCGNDPVLNIIDEITVEVWVKSNGFKTGGGIVSKGSWSNRGYFISYAYSPHCVYFGVRDNSGHHTVYTGLCEQFDWAHIAGVKKDNKLEVYVNGKKKNEWSGTLSSISNPSLNLTIGKSSNGYYFNGSIDNVSIYNEALSSAQIQQHYAAGAPFHGIAINN